MAGLGAASGASADALASSGLRKASVASGCCCGGFCNRGADVMGGGNNGVWLDGKRCCGVWRVAAASSDAAPGSSGVSLCQCAPSPALALCRAAAIALPGALPPLGGQRPAGGGSRLDDCCAGWRGCRQKPPATKQPIRSSRRRSLKNAQRCCLLASGGGALPGVSESLVVGSLCGVEAVRRCPGGGGDAAAACVVGQQLHLHRSKDCLSRRKCVQCVHDKGSCNIKTNLMKIRLKKMFKNEFFAVGVGKFILSDFVPHMPGVT